MYDLWFAVLSQYKSDLMACSDVDMSR